MTIDQINVVDFAGIDPKTDDAVLFITDHLEWEEDDRIHMSLLQDKINAYVRSIESGEIYHLYPKAAAREIVVRVLAKYPLSEEAKIFFEKIRSSLFDAGYKIELERAP
jgi:hypothetical protein